jgi:hypothetical protein
LAYGIGNPVSFSVTFPEISVVCAEIVKMKENEEIKDSFCLKERQLSISTIKKSNITLSGLEEYAPKISNLLELLKLNGKHLIYCNFIELVLRRNKKSFTN